MSHACEGNAIGEPCPACWSFAIELACSPDAPQSMNIRPREVWARVSRIEVRAPKIARVWVESIAIANLEMLKAGAWALSVDRMRYFGFFPRVHGAAGVSIRLRSSVAQAVTVWVHFEHEAEK